MKLEETDQSTTLEMSPEEWDAFKRALQFSVKILAGKFKEVKDVEDDERSVTWAPEKIRGLQQLAADQAVRVLELGDLVKQLEQRLAANWVKIANRITSLEVQVSNLADNVVPSSRISELARRMTSESKRINELRTQISALESNFDSHLQRAAQHDHPDDMAERIGGVAQADVTGDEMRARITGAAAMREEQYFRGWSAGLAAAIDEAQSRLQEAFDRSGGLLPTERVMDVLRQVVVTRQASSN